MSSAPLPEDTVLWLRLVWPDPSGGRGAARCGGSSGRSLCSGHYNMTCRDMSLHDNMT